MPLLCMFSIRLLSQSRKRTLTVCFSALLISYFGTPHVAFASSYFNMSEVFSRDVKPFPKWTGMIERYDEQKEVPDEECDRTQFHPCSIHEWRELISTLRSKPFAQQMDQVNTWGNDHPYITDMMNWGVEDYWETPHEFMEVKGDCEDYAIAKYYTLRAMGMPAERMRIIILQDFNLGGIIHAVLGVYGPKGEMVILDNQSRQVIPALKIYHYKPIYGINEQGWWAYHPKG